MIPAQLRWPSQPSQVITLQGGVDENVSSLQQNPGSLLEVANYMIAEGTTGGYQSIAGYERYDGRPLSSTLTTRVMTIESPLASIVVDDVITGATGSAIALGTAITINGSLQVEVNITSDTFVRGEALTVGATPVGNYKNTGTVSSSDNFHAVYDANRALIKPVGDTDCEGPVLGVVLYKDKVYAFRKKVGINFVGMYEASATGWVEVDTSGDPIVFGEHSFIFTIYNFYASAGTKTLYWVDGVNQCRSFDGTTISTIANSGMVSLGKDKPINIMARSNRLFLAYAGGSLQYSELGVPTGWDGVNGAGELGIGDEITNLVLGVGNALVILCTDSILILSGESTDTFNMKTFSPTSGAYQGTAKRLLGTIFFLDDRGVTTMEAVEAFGDFAANSISQNFKKTLFNNVDKLTTSIVSRDLNQYRLYFSNGLGIIVSFEGKDIKGATFTQFPIAVKNTAEGSLSNKRNILLFTTDTPLYEGENVDGYVYVMDSGPSFDTHPIITRMITSYYHYNSPRKWKRFISAMIEGDINIDTTFDIRVDYDYGSRQLPKAVTIFDQIGEVVGGSLYGSGEYGEAIYGSGPVLSRTPVYLTGIGTNASFKILTKLRFANQHVMQTLLVDYNVLSRRI